MVQSKAIALVYVSLTEAEPPETCRTVCFAFAFACTSPSQLTHSPFSSNTSWISVRCVLGSAINGPVAKECADLWPRIASNAGSIV